MFFVDNFGGFYGLGRFCNAGLPSDITVVVESVNFHLHKVSVEVLVFLANDAGLNIVCL